MAACLGCSHRYAESRLQSPQYRRLSFCKAIIGLQGFFPLKGTAAVGVGALEYPSTERKRLAAL